LLVIAHRGASLDAPENTLEAFRLAVSQGADMIETDLHLTRDSAVAIFHDAEIEGEPIAGASLAALRQRRPSLPALDDVLDELGGIIPFNLELKRGVDGDYAGMVERVLDAVRRRGLLSSTLFSSFYDSMLAELHELEPRARIGLLVSRRAPVSILERARRVEAEAVHPELSLATEELVGELHGAGFRVNVYTVDDTVDQRRLIEWGVDGLFTNVPARLRELLDA
jgi:glycerophosphoryl diester phosphodiesterase